MSIEKTTVQHRKFIVKAGMTAEDVKKSKDATALQKKYANVFDSDGQKGFSQKEADLFNATTFSEKADGSVMFWTRQKDGTKKGVKFSGNIDEMNYSVKSEVKPYVTTKKVAKKTVKQPKQEEVSFWDSKWSGHQIAKLTGDNDFTDWLQDKDKVCTDGKDDGKIGFWEGTKNLAKGLIGGIPKAMINHPVATAVTVGIGAAATALTGGAILPVLGAIGVASGVGMAGYGTYKAATAKTDGEAKQALETLGMGVTTTVLSSASAGKALESAQSAGVKSAKVAEDANILTKTAQMFKATPEALKVSGRNAKISLKNVYTMSKYNERTFFDGTKEVYRGKNGQVKRRILPDGTEERYDKNGAIATRILPNGTEERYGKYGTYKYFSNGDQEQFWSDGTLKERFVKSTDTHYYYDSKGQLTKEVNYHEGRNISYKPDGSAIIREGSLVKYQNKDGIITKVQDLFPELKNDRIARMQEFIKEAEANKAPEQVISDLKEVLGMVKQAKTGAEVNDLPFPSYNQGHKYAEITRYDVDGSFADQTYNKGAGYIMKNSEVKAAQGLNQQVNNESHPNLLGIDQKYYDEQIRLHGECTVPMW